MSSVSHEQSTRVPGISHTTDWIALLYEYTLQFVILLYVTATVPEPLCMVCKNKGTSKQSNLLKLTNLYGQD